MPRATDTPGEGSVWALWLAHREHRVHEMLSFMHHDVVWSRPGKEYRGHDQIRQMVMELRADVGGYAVRLDAVSEVNPDLVLARGRVIPNGTDRVANVTWRVHLADGLVTRVETFLPASGDPAGGDYLEGR